MQYIFFLLNFLLINIVDAERLFGPHCVAFSDESFVTSQCKDACCCTDGFCTCPDDSSNWFVSSRCLSVSNQNENTANILFFQNSFHLSCFTHHDEAEASQLQQQKKVLDSISCRSCNKHTVVLPFVSSLLVLAIAFGTFGLKTRAHHIFSSALHIG